MPNRYEDEGGDRDQSKEEMKELENEVPDLEYLSLDSESESDSDHMYENIPGPEKEKERDDHRYENILGPEEEKERDDQKVNSADSGLSGQEEPIQE